MKNVLMASVIISSLALLSLPLKTQAEMTHAEIRTVVDKIVDMPTSEEEGVSYTEMNQIRSAFKAYGESRRILLKKVKDAMQRLNISMDFTGETSTAHHPTILKAAAPTSSEIAERKAAYRAEHTSTVASPRIRQSATSPALALRQAQQEAAQAETTTRKVLFSQQGGIVNPQRIVSDTYHFPKKMLKSKKKYSASPLFRLRMM